jgi:hypothetical protein
MTFFGWSPGIGDPTIYGWLTVAAYAIGAACCWWASERAPRRERRFWWALSLVMAFLCINKQLDLQSLFTDFGRFEAQKHGWYAERHGYQVAFIILLGIVTLAALAALLARARRASRPVRGAMCGLAFLLLFILVRASSFHKVDWFINLRLGSLKANHLMELGGITLVTVFSLAAIPNRRKRQLTG